MADLRQLDEAALSDGEEQDRSPEDSDSIDQQQQQPQQQEQQEAQDWDDSGRQEIHVQQQQDKATTATSSALSEDEDDGEASDAGLDDAVTTASKSSLQVAANLEELPYARLYHSWIQECRCPELVPLDHDTIATMRSVVADAEDPHDSDNDDEQQQQQQHDNQHHHVKALLQSVRHVEAQRVKFLLADLVQRRLHKIQAHPQHTMKNLTDRMSDAEVC